MISCLIPTNLTKRCGIRELFRIFERISVCEETMDMKAYCPPRVRETAWEFERMFLFSMTNTEPIVVEDPEIEW
jgi:hypothetical protein